MDYSGDVVEQVAAIGFKNAIRLIYGEELKSPVVLYLIIVFLF